MDPDPLALVGTTIADKYRVESVVGEGGFAVVYKATHLVWNLPVALKVFKALGEVREGRRKQLFDDFVREGSLLVELSERSTAIVQARDIGMVTLPGGGGEAVPFMVLEWLDGETLEALIAREAAAGRAPRSLDAAAALLAPVAEALALAHTKGIAHRDVKPGNVFVVGDVYGDHTVKLLDFGIAKVVQEAAKEDFRKTTGRSSFTPLYAAPEQFDRTLGGTGPWTDVFAFALVFVELLLGHEALQGDSLLELARAAANERVRPSPRGRGLDVPDAVEAVFLRALSVSPERRYQDMGELWLALGRALSVSGHDELAPRGSLRGVRAASLASIRVLPAASAEAGPSLEIAQTVVLPDEPSGASPPDPGATQVASAPSSAPPVPTFPPPDPKAARGLAALVVALGLLFVVTGALLAAFAFDKI
ncbi:MAG TPA: serine/threonine-protein kinase [Polyangiaceae bacterium]|nr:serine/threonine-protein kinase [Polyangiaceae bacterium]